MKRAFRPRLEPAGPEGIPLVGVRPTTANGTFLRGGSCVGEPKVRSGVTRASEEGGECWLHLLSISVNQYLSSNIWREDQRLKYWQGSVKG